jgi:hypothetical protein
MFSGIIAKKTNGELKNKSIIDLLFFSLHVIMESQSFQQMSCTDCQPYSDLIGIH